MASGVTSPRCSAVPRRRRAARFVSLLHCPAAPAADLRRTLGSTLGPDGLSLYLSAELELPFGRVSPWVESVRFSSDTYKDDGGGDGGIQVDRAGPMERRVRAGVDLAIALRQSLRLDVNAWLERVTNADLQPGSSRLNAGLAAALRFTPDFR